MSLPSTEICYLEVDDFNLYEEEATDHAFAREGDIVKLGPRGEVKMEAEKRIRREIANSNERRRMQSINAGFQALRTLLPRHEGEKLSKAAILQQTAEYIYSLEQEKTRLLSQNCQLKRLLNQHEGGEVPLKKRKNEITLHHTATSIIPDSTDDTVITRSPEPVPVINVPNGIKKDEPSELRSHLDRERKFRVVMEDKVRTLDTQAFPESAHDLSQHVTLHYSQAEVTVAAVAVEPVEDVKEEPSSPDAPLLEAAIKAEPRVEVEMLGEQPDSRLYLASTSRQNLETIVEAIRHLEGDHLFGEAAEAPLALTKKPQQEAIRPGVIVVKQS